MKIVRFDLPYPRVTEDDIQDVLSPERRDPVLKKKHLSNHKPIICDIVVADNGYLWLKKGEHIRNRNVEEPITYMIIDDRGEYLADQTLPIALEAVKDGNVYGFLTREDGVKIYKRYVLRKL